MSHLNIHIRTEVDVDERIENPVNLHQFLPPLRPRLLRSIEEEPDESPLRVLPLGLGDHVAAIEDLHIGQPRHQHRPLLLAVQLIKERTALDPEIIESRKPSEFLHLLPAVDLGGGHVEAGQPGGDVVQLVQGGEVSNGTLRQAEELNPEISNLKYRHVTAEWWLDLPWALGQKAQ